LEKNSGKSVANTVGETLWQKCHKLLEKNSNKSIAYTVGKTIHIFG